MSTFYNFTILNTPSNADFLVGYRASDGEYTRYTFTDIITKINDNLTIDYLGKSKSNYLRCLGGIVGNPVKVEAIGADTNINLEFYAKGSGDIVAKADILTDGNNINTEGGDLSTEGGSINSGAGIITNSGGFNTTGNYTTSANITINGTGNFTINTGDITTSGDIIMLGGYLTASTSTATFFQVNASSTSVINGVTFGNNINYNSKSLLNIASIQTNFITGNAFDLEIDCGDIRSNSAIEALYVMPSVSHLLEGAASAVQGDGELESQINIFTTVTSGSGCTLPNFSVLNNDVMITVVNLGANSLNIFPPIGYTIDALAVNAPFVLTNVVKTVRLVSDRNNLKIYSI